jgi:hypothetical protein
MLLTAMTISAVIILVSAGKSVERQKAAAAARQADMAQHDPVGFVLGEYNGKLALFRENSVRPYKLLDMEVYLLSEEDRAALEKGIVFETEEELLRVLEDWNS